MSQAICLASISLESLKTKLGLVNQQIPARVKLGVIKYPHIYLFCLYSTHDSQKDTLFESKIPKLSGYSIFFSLSRWSQISIEFWDWGNVCNCISKISNLKFIYLYFFCFFPNLFPNCRKFFIMNHATKENRRTFWGRCFCFHPPLRSKSNSKWKMAIIWRPLNLKNCNQHSWNGLKILYKPI